MHRKVRIFILMLLAVMLPTAWVFADWQVVIAPMEHGTVKTNATTAEEGTTVVLTVTPDKDYLINIKELRVEMITDDDEGDTPILKAPRRAPSIGAFVELTQTGQGSYSFEMPASDVLVSAAFVEAGPFDVSVETDDMGSTPTTITVTPNYDDMTAIVTAVNIGSGANPTLIHIPATVTDPAGNELTVTTIANGSFLGAHSITDIYLPDTEEPLTIEEGAFLLDNETGSGHRIATIHTPLHLLDDYALMTPFSENYGASKMKGITTVQHRLWTLSCGVDVKLPADMQPYIVYANGAELIYEKLQVDGYVIANNGVLVEKGYDGEQTIEVTAMPTSSHPTGSKLSTDNARSYPGNQLVPVIVKHHFFAERDNYVLVNNQFRPIAYEDVSVCCPPCKAVLHLSKEGAIYE